MGRVARSERTKSQLRAEARGLKRARQVMARPAPKRKPVGVLAPGAKFNRRTGKITSPKRRVTRKTKQVLGTRRPTGALLGANTRQLQADARRLSRDRDELIRNRVVLPRMPRDPAKAKTYTRVPLPKSERTAEGREFKWVEKKAPAVSRSFFDPITPKAKREAKRADKRLTRNIQRQAARDYANVLKKPKNLGEVPSKRESAERLRNLKVLSGESRLDRTIKRERARQLAARRPKKDKSFVGAAKQLFGVGTSAKSGNRTGAAFSGSAGLGAPAGYRVPRRGSIILQEIARNPRSQANKNASAAAKSLVSIPAGLAAMVADPKKSAKETIADPIKRWNESDEQFRKRVRKEGFLPEALDATIVLGGSGAVASRVAQRAAATGRLGKKAKKASQYTRRELVSGGEKEGVIVQGPSKSFIRNVARKKIDDRRKAKTRKRVERDKTKIRYGETAPRGADALDELAVEADLPTVAGKRRARRARRLMATDSGRFFQMMKAEQADEVTGSDKETIGSQIGRLNKRERVAYRYVTENGITDLDGFVRELTQLRDKMATTRAATDPKKLGKVNQVDEIDKMLGAPSRYFTERVVEVARNVAPKQLRLAKEEDPGVTAAEAERRRFRPFEVMNDIEDRSAVKLVDSQKELDALTPEQLRREGYVAARYQLQTKRVDDGPIRTAAEQNAHTRKIMRQRGLDPDVVGYYKNQEFSTRGLSNYAPGGRRAVRGEQKYTGELLRRGSTVSDARIVVDTAAGNIKRKYNWNRVGLFAERSAFSWSRKVKNGRVREIMREAERRGISDDSYRLIDLRQIYRDRDAAIREGEFDADAVNPELRAEEVAKSIERNTLDPRSLTAADFEKTGYVAVSKADYNELLKSTTPSGGAGRALDIARGAASRWLLLNLPWLVFQTGSNSILSVLAGVTPADMARAARFFKDMPVRERRAYEAFLGVHGWYDQRTRMGATADGRMANVIAAYKRTDHYQRWRQYGVPAWLDLFARLDNMQNNAFRRAVGYKILKSEAFTRMNDAEGRIYGTFDRLQAALGKKSHEEVMRALLKEQDTVEQLGRAVDDWLGNWTSYTATERQYLVRLPLFYGFIRFSTRLAFYTMPINHPVLSSILLRLGDLSRQELEAIYGAQGTEPPPWEYGNFYLLGGDGKYHRYQLSRLVPFFNALQVTNDPKNVLNPQVSDLVGLMNPLVLLVLEQASYTRNGRPIYDFYAEGEGQGLFDAKRFRFLVKQLLSYNWYVKTLEQTGIPRVDLGPLGSIERKPLRGEQEPDSSFAFPRPKKYKQADSIEENRALKRQQNRLGVGGIAKERLAPYFGTDPFPQFRQAEKYKESKKGKKGKKGSPYDTLFKDGQDKGKYDGIFKRSPNSTSRDGGIFYK